VVKIFGQYYPSKYEEIEEIRNGENSFPLARLFYLGAPPSPKIRVHHLHL
jgi:hypothetical protein